MKAIKIAQMPPPTVSRDASVSDAIPAMISEHGCAVAVMDGPKLVGTLSKEQILQRIVAVGRDPKTTKVGEIMTSPPQTAFGDVETDDALRMMFSLHQCYLPVVNHEGDLTAWLAICHLFENNVEDLARQIDSMAAYIGADGPGGD